jgi:ADP-heptose:LPS heptosyltransferase
VIVIQPFSRALNNGKQNPKNYPYWQELIKLIDEPIVQIGTDGERQLTDDFRTNLSISDLKALIHECRTWIGVDSFFQHLCWSEGKQGIVLWSVSDPLIFGHSENINLLKDRNSLAANQFLWWENTKHNFDHFVKPEEILPHIIHVGSLKSI